MYSVYIYSDAKLALLRTHCFCVRCYDAKILHSLETTPRIQPV